MHIHWILKLILESFNFGFLIKKFFFFETDLGFEFIDASNLAIDRQVLISKSSKLELIICELL